MQISIHPASDMDSVYKFIPKKYFSSDMGGEAPSFEARKGINIVPKYIYITYYVLPIVLSSLFMHKYNTMTATK